MSDKDNDDQLQASLGRIAEAVARVNRENEPVRAAIRQIVIEEQTALWGYDFSKDENRREARTIYEEARNRRKNKGVIFDKVFWPIVGAISTAIIAFTAAHVNVGLK